MPESLDTLPEPQVTVLEDGTKIIVEYSFDEQGNKLKTTRKIKTTVLKTKVNHEIAERKRLAKFGEAKGFPPGPDSKSTTLGDAVFLKMTQGIKEAEAVNTDALKKEALSKANISCRICKGDHWTSKCPYKDNQTPQGESSEPKSEKSTKYVPPSMRGKGEGTSEARDRRDESVVRVTNLSEDVSEPDLRALFSRIGPVSRIYVARDMNTNVCKGFAFVNYIHKDDALLAVEKLDQHRYDNLIMRVEMSNRQRD